MPEHVVYATPAGSPLQFKIITTHPVERSSFKVSEWNQIQRAGLQGCCDYWIDNYLMLRFEQYARAMGIYTGAKRTGLPLVHTGYLRSMVAQTSRVEVTATSKTARAIIVIPMPNVPNATPGKGVKYMNYEGNAVVASSLSAITTQELDRMSVVCAAIMTEMIESSSITSRPGRGGRPGKIIASLSPQHAMTPAELRHRAMAGQRRPRMRLTDFQNARLTKGA